MNFRLMLLPIIFAASSCAATKNEMALIHGDRAHDGADFNAEDLDGSWLLGSSMALVLTSVGKTPYVAQGSLQWGGGEFHRQTMFSTALSTSSSSLPQAGSQALQVTQTGRYAVGTPIDRTHLGLVLSELQTTETPLTAAAAADLNAQAECGHKDWVANQPLDVTATVCNNFKLNHDGSVNAVSHFGGDTFDFVHCDGKACSVSGFDSYFKAPHK